MPNVLRVVPNAEKDHLVAASAAPLGLTTAERFGGGDGPCGSTLAPGVGGRTALMVRVQTGCEERCTYCIIPATRGASRSRALDLLVADIERAVAAGYREIVLTGVHLGSYGRDLADGSSLTTLVGRLSTWPDEVLFRISSLEPMDCTAALIDLVAGSPRLAPHFHLPLQHGSDPMLRAMRRPYTAAQYTRLVERIRSAMPHASIGSDIIVGFPGEMQAHFEEMRQLLGTLPLAYLHVFPYSDRPGTEAAAMTGKVDGPEIRERGRRIRAVAEDLAARFKDAQTGRIRRALTVDDGRSVVTDNYLKLRLDAAQPRNEWVRVRVESRDAARVIAT